MFIVIRQSWIHNDFSLEKYKAHNLFKNSPTWKKKVYKSNWTWDWVCFSWSPGKIESLQCSFKYHDPLAHLKSTQFVNIQRILDFSGAHLLHTMGYICKNLFISLIPQFLQKHHVPHFFEKNKKITEHLVQAEN